VLKIGVVGTGHMGKYHINNLSTVPNVDFASICDLNEEVVKKISTEYGVKGYSDYKKFLSSVDAVIIAVPTFLHYKFASEALEAGKHILLEKPMTKTIYFAEKLIKLAYQKNLVLQVGHVERFNGAVQELKNVVKNPYLIQSQRMGPRSRIKDVGVVLDLMIHDIDIVTSIAGGDLVDVEAHGHKIYTGFEDVANASLYFSNGCVANITSSRVSEAKMRSMAISQEGSYIALNFETQEITITRQPTSQYTVQKEEIKYKQENIVEKVFIHKDNALRLEQIHFVECILDSREPIRKSEDDLAALILAKKIIEKIYTGWKQNG
jgi:predicted dehydrogenase